MSPGLAARERGRGSWLRARRKLHHLFWIACMLVGWQALAGFAIVPAFIVSTPLRLLEEIAALLTSIDTLDAVRITLAELLIGLFAGAAVGTLLGTLFARIRLLDAIMKPVALAFYTVPRLALLPLFVVWFGLGMGSKIAVVFIHGAVLFLLGAYAAVSNINQKYIDSVVLFGANALQRLHLVYLPSALPYLVTSARQALGLATGSLIVAETSASLGGMGFQIGLRLARFDMTGVLAWVMLAAMLALVLDWLGLLLYRRVTRWSPSRAIEQQ